MSKCVSVIRERERERNSRESRRNGERENVTIGRE